MKELQIKIYVDKGYTFYDVVSPESRLVAEHCFGHALPQMFGTNVVPSTAQEFQAQYNEIFELHNYNLHVVAEI